MWNLFFTLYGPGGTMETPNQFNPVEADGIETLLRQLADKLPDLRHLGVEIVGIRIERAGVQP